MTDDIDLHGLTAAQAREYTLQFVANMKELENRRQDLRRRFESWEHRVKLARENQRIDLVQEAIDKLEEITRRYQELGREKRELEVKVALLKQRLRRLEREPQKTVNAEALLEQLEQVAGSDQHLKEKISRMEADDKLDELRRKLTEEEEE